MDFRPLHDRVLVSLDGERGERRSGGGIVIPATASVGKRLAWATVVAVGLFATPYVPLMPSIAVHFFDGQSSTVGSMRRR